MVYALGTLGIVLVLAIGGWLYATNVEQPDYRIIAAEGPIEHRAYGPLIAAEVTRTGTRNDAVRSGFGPLARYIFAREREGEKIAMTAPVTQRAAPGDGWTVTFFMPSGYRIEDLPDPAQGDVRLAPVPARERAAIRFSGVADDALIARNETRLRDWMAARGLTPDGAPIYAYYNDPLTPGFLRRNEVLFDLAPGG